MFLTYGNEIILKLRSKDLDLRSSNFGRMMDIITSSISFLTSNSECGVLSENVASVQFTKMCIKL